MQIAKDIAVFPDNEPFVFQLKLVAKRIVHSEQQVEQDNPRKEIRDNIILYKRYDFYTQ